MQSPDHLSQELPQRHYDITRDEFVERFLEPWDQAQVIEQGMLDNFYVDSESGYDALLHIFCGESTAKNDVTRVFGFHLEATAPTRDTRGITLPDNQLTKTSRERVLKQDFEPYNIPVVIQGHNKSSHSKVKIRGGTRVSVNTMFGRAYDAFSIMKNLVDAVRDRDPVMDVAAEKPTVRPDLRSKYFMYEMPILGTDLTAPVRIVLEASSDKILAAVPLLRSNQSAKLGSISLSETNDLLLQ